MKLLLKSLGIILLLILLLVLAFLLWASMQKSVPANYQSKVKTGAPLEAQYLAQVEQSFAKLEAGTLQNFKKYIFYYPQKIEKPLPVLVFLNGTGTPASKYPALLESYAKRGYLVAATEEEFSWNALSADLLLKNLYKLHENETVEGFAENPFYQKIDFDKVAVLGHSQGGVGVFNAITKGQYAHLYKTAIALSPTNYSLAKNLDWDFDISTVNIPLFLLAGTGKGDENLVINLEQLKELYNLAEHSPYKLSARRNDADHGHTLYFADGYVNAWLSWHLLGDEQAKQAFVGENAEILQNALYQDIEKSE